MSALGLLLQSEPPSLAVFLVAAVSGFIVLMITLWAGRSVESGGGRLLLFLLGLALATAMVLLVLVLFGGMSFDVVNKIG